MFLFFLLLSLRNYLLIVSSSDFVLFISFPYILMLFFPSSLIRLCNSSKMDILIVCVWHGPRAHRSRINRSYIAHMHFNISVRAVCGHFIPFSFLSCTLLSLLRFSLGAPCCVSALRFQLLFFAKLCVRSLKRLNFFLKLYIFGKIDLYRKKISVKIGKS